MNRKRVMACFSGASLEVLVTALLMVANEITLALLMRTGNMPDGLNSWSLWRVSLLVAAGIVLLSRAVSELYEWIVPSILVMSWLMLLAWYGMQAFWYWQVPVLDLRALCFPPLFGMTMTGLAVYGYWVGNR